MRVRKLSPTGDYQFGNGQADFYQDVPEAVGQVCVTRLKLWLGEWFLDVEDGTPYMQTLLGKHPNLLESANVTVQQRAIDTQGALDVKNFESALDPDTRAYSASFDLDTIYGPTQVQIDNQRNY